MSKSVAFWMMTVGALASAYDLGTTPSGGSGGALYGPGKPLEKMRWKIYTTAGGTNIYASVSDVAAVAGAFFYFK